MDSEAGPSNPKRSKLRVRNEKKLTENELLMLAYLSSDEELGVQEFEDSGSEWEDTDYSDGDSASSIVGDDDEHMDRADDGDQGIAGNDNGPDLARNTPNWQDDPRCFKNISFVKQNELLVDVPGNNEPIDYFFLLFDQNVLSMIVEQTNSYAIDVFVKEGKQRNHEFRSGKI
ncbi:unnamed protein product [Acanthoscelides obtectus]|uniref:PiggyBac transposable element-derived protein domain-containing protein n=1 Tax=Acanthoscelides obtectus TaxID=200917 RepID=A0A9P0NY98_ACAOB|nr:unnamed protein product [Acanthoscelides obtectus]CAK1679406.1 hypothetical protein AOBTE_LOCUS32235 [Acanthoscelides obtectus]